MVKIRKKTSKRQPTRLREKIKHKVAESNRKSKRTAKKDVTWKSKVKKDPGIPANFPYKEQILEEIKLTRQQNEIAKAEKKKQVLEQIGLSENGPIPSTSAEPIDADVEDSIDEATSFLNAATSTNLRTYAKSLRNVLQQSDIIIQVLDARDPLGTRSKETEKDLLNLPGNKKLILVLNKIDLVPRENVEGWLSYLRKSFPTLPFRSSTQSQRRNLASGTTSTTGSTSAVTSTKPLITLLKNYSRFPTSSVPSTEKFRGITSITVGVIGMPNVGKSSLINTLKRAKVCGVAPVPGFTKQIQEIVIDSSLKILDCPGVVLENEDNGPRAILRNALRVEQIDDPIPPVEMIISKCRPEHLMILYNLPAFSNSKEFLISLARVKGRLKKGGIPDIDSAARGMLRDWNTGIIPYYSTPPLQPVAPTSQTTSTGNSNKIAVSDGADVGQASILTELAPEFNLDELFGEADQEALADAKSLKESRGALKFIEEEELQQGRRVKLLGEETSDEEMDTEEADPLPTQVRGKRSAATANLDTTQFSAPKKKVTFSEGNSKPVLNGKLFEENDPDLPPTSTAKKQRKVAKKERKLANRKTNSTMDSSTPGDVILESQTEALTLMEEPFDETTPYDFANFFPSTLSHNSQNEIDNESDEEL